MGGRRKEGSGRGVRLVGCRGARGHAIFVAGSNPRSREARGRLNSAERSNSAEIDFGEVVGRIWQRTGEFGRTTWGNGFARTMIEPAIREDGNWIGS